MNTPLWAILVTVAGSFFASIGSVFLKLASKEIRDLKSFILNKWIYLGVFVYSFSTAASWAAMSVGDLSVIFPIFALSFVWTVILSKKIFNEKVVALHWGGVALILCGVVLISFAG